MSDSPLVDWDKPAYEQRPTDFTEKHSTHTIPRISRKPSYDDVKSSKAQHHHAHPPHYGQRQPGNSKPRQLGREFFCCGRKDVLRRFQPRAVLILCSVGAFIFMIPTLFYGNILYRPPIYGNLDISTYAGDNEEYVQDLLGGKGLYFVGWWILWPILMFSFFANFLYLMSYCCFSRGAAVSATIMMLFFGFIAFIFMIIFFCAAGRWSYFFGNERAVEHLRYELAMSNAYTDDLNDVDEWLKDHEMAYWIAATCLLLHWLAVWAVVAPLAVCFLKQKGHDDEEVGMILPVTQKDKEAVYGANHRYTNSVRTRAKVKILKKPPKLAPENVLEHDERYHKNLRERVLNSTDHYEGQPDCYHGPECDHGMGFMPHERHYQTDLSHDPTLSTHRPSMKSIMRSHSADTYKSNADMSMHNPAREIPEDREYWGVPRGRNPAPVPSAMKRSRSVPAPRNVTFASQSTYINLDSGTVENVNTRRASIQHTEGQMQHRNNYNRANATHPRKRKKERSSLNCWNWRCAPEPVPRQGRRSSEVYYDISDSNYYNAQRNGERRHSNPVISSSRNLQNDEGHIS